MPQTVQKQSIARSVISRRLSSYCLPLVAVSLSLVASAKWESGVRSVTRMKQRSVFVASHTLMVKKFSLYLTHGSRPLRNYKLATNITNPINQIRRIICRFVMDLYFRRVSNNNLKSLSSLFCTKNVRSVSLCVFSFVY